jgi:hypothetical protein
MEESVSEGREEAFGEGSPEYNYAKDYLTELRTNWRNIQNSMSRAAWLIVVTAVVFELILTNAASESSFLFIKLTKVGPVVFALPAITAYQYYTVTLLGVGEAFLHATHKRILNKLYPLLGQPNYHLPLYPSNALNYGGTEFGQIIPTKRKRSRRAFGFSSGIRRLAIFLGPLLFLIVAYIQLFLKYGTMNLLLWISLFIAVVLTASATINNQIGILMASEAR